MDDNSSSRRSAAAPAGSAEAERSTGETQGDVQVRVKFIGRASVSLVCSATLVVAELKKKVAEADSARDAGVGGGDGAALRLIYKGKVLKDGQTLSQCGFRSQDTIHAVVKQPTGEVQAQESPARSTTGASAPSTGGGGFVADSTEWEDVGDGMSMRIHVLRDGDGFSSVSDLLESIFSEDEDSAVATSDTNASDRPEASAVATTPTESDAGFPARTSAEPAAPVITLALGSMADPSQPRNPLDETISENTLLAKMVHDDAAVLREEMSVSRYAPRSCSPGRSQEMFDAGDALKDASGVFLALHRELEAISAKLLTGRTLGHEARVNLQSRVNGLVDATSRAGSFASIVNKLLAGIHLIDEREIQTTACFQSPGFDGSANEQSVSSAPASRDYTLPSISATPFADFLQKVLQQCDESFSQGLKEFLIHSSKELRKLFPPNAPFDIINQRRRMWCARAVEEIAAAVANVTGVQGEGSTVQGSGFSTALGDRIDRFVLECLAFDPSQLLPSIVVRRWCVIWTCLRVFIMATHSSIRDDSAIHHTITRLLGRLPRQRATLHFNFLVMMTLHINAAVESDRRTSEQLGA